MSITRRPWGGHARLVEETVARCAAHGMAPARVVPELTETAAMAVPAASLDRELPLRAAAANPATRLGARSACRSGYTR